MNKNIQVLNEGKKHQPIKKVRIYEVGNKFSVGEEGAKSKKYVEAAKGTNLFFAIYWDDKKKKRDYETIPLEKVIAWQKEEASLPKQQRTGVPINNMKGQFLFSLSPNDMVYVPNEEEKNNPLLINFKNLTVIQINNIYKMDKASGKECYFTRFDIASLIYPYSSKSKFGELGSQNKLQTTMCENNFKIVESCIKLEIDKLGNVKRGK